MCSYFLKNMENYNIQGDLAEIFHVSAAATDGGFTTAAANPEWQFPTNFCFDPAEDFGQPFSHIRDPFTNTSVENTGNCLGFSATNNSNYGSSSNSFSRMTISSSSACESQSILNGPDHLLVSDHNNHNLISSNGSKGCLLENPADMQISSPRNTGIKRRKSQAKKVVCIPAPSPAKGSWSSGEVVPSDLWAWRKYGQKPIKGSPHPRGYYRCSSSKGCLAKKQVERSRNDPNMLVITYTSEHNHPWPTQRNALAGSSRSQPHKNKITAKNSPKKSTNPKEDDHKTITTTDNSITKQDPSFSACVKEETDHQVFDNRLEMDDPGFDEGFRKSYKPTLLDSNQLSEDSFFSDLGEIEGDPLDLFFMQGFSGRENKGLDPFSFHDWVTNRDS